MRAARAFAFSLIILFGGLARADAPTAVPSATEVLQRLVHDNDRFVATHDAHHFAPFRDEQHPGATVVACSDSRFHTHAIDENPDGDLFVIRDIGNQVDQAGGSVAYGVEHLHTPLLLIIGHVRCGAVKAALGDYSTEPVAIRRELDGLHLSLARVHATASADDRWQAGVLANVHQQVANALHEFHNPIAAGTLTVVGAVYDFRNDLHRGLGRLVIVDVNGETDAAKIASSTIVKTAQATTL